MITLHTVFILIMPHDPIYCVLFVLFTLYKLTHPPHCVVSLSKTHLSLLSTDSTQEDPFRHNLKVVDWDVKNQIRQTKLY